MLPAALAALLVGCRFEPVGAVPDDGAPPPPPDVPVDASVDAPPPDAIPDRDLDTIPDAVDNCPDDSNLDQADCDGDDLGDACDPRADGADADGDMVSDVCDNCPTVINLDQAAVLDDDEVGDACDPRATEGGDTIAYFSGFDGDSDGDQPGGWSLASGEGLVNAQWRVVDGKLVHDAGEQASILYLSGRTVPADVVVEARFSVSTFVPDGGNPAAFVGVLSRYANGLAGEGEDVGYLCQLEQGTSGDPTADVRIQDLAGSATGFDEAPWSGQLNQSYTITHLQAGIAGSGAISRCTVTPPAPFMAESVRVDDIPGPPGGSIALRTLRIGAAFDYILVYGLGPSTSASVTATPSPHHPAP
jgi:hypothetical protein